MLRDLLPGCDLLDPVVGHPSPLCRVKLNKVSSFLWSFSFFTNLNLHFLLLLSYHFIGTFLYLLFDLAFCVNWSVNVEMFE